MCESKTKDEELTITNNDTKLILCRDIIATFDDDENVYYLPNYQINDMKVKCEITLQNNSYYCNIWHEPNQKFKKIILRLCFIKIANIVDFLLVEFRHGYKFSKITDYFECLDYIEDNEKEKLAFYHVRTGINTRNDLSCCVCYDCCLTETACKHKICRICVGKLQQKVCPLCKQLIN